MLVILLLLVGAYAVSANPALPTKPSMQFLGAPNASYWSSGWQTVLAGQCQTFTHNLGGDVDNFAVDLLFSDTDAGGVGLNRRDYGGLESGGNRYGAHWEKLTNTTVDVCREAQDIYADQIRIVVWVAPTPDYARTWTNIAQGETQTINHNLNLTAADLSVSLYFQSAARGIHQYAYGGLTEGILGRGAYWSNLTNTTVDVTRRAQDTYVERVRVVVTHTDPPAYDSGWTNVNQNQALPFNHNLNWPPEMLLVRGECSDLSTTGFAGINHIFAGGDHHNTLGFRGGNLQNLTSNSVTFYRQANDTTCPQAHIVIYKRSAMLYLPLVLR